MPHHQVRDLSVHHRRAIIGVPVLLATLLACSAQPPVWACATVDGPPIVHADGECPADRNASAGGLSHRPGSPAGNSHPEPTTVSGTDGTRLLCSDEPAHATRSGAEPDDEFEDEPRPRRNPALLVTAGAVAAALVVVSVVFLISARSSATDPMPTTDVDEPIAQVPRTTRAPATTWPPAPGA